MNAARKLFETRVTDIDGITIDTWKDTELVCLFYHGKEFAHFHGDTILDIRLSAKLIKAEGLARDVTKEIHPNRSPNSIWIGIAILNEDEVDHAIHLVKQALNI